MTDKKTTPEKLHAWQKDFTLKDPLLEIDVENLERAIMDFPYATLRAAGITNLAAAATLKSAIAADWIVAPECEVGEFDGQKRYFYAGKDIDEMHPGAVKWLGNQIDAAYTAVTFVPKAL